jgi:hypothetical protein
MDELEKRLRMQAASGNSYARQAADEIARLRAENERLRAAQEGRRIYVDEEGSGWRGVPRFRAPGKETLVSFSPENMHAMHQSGAEFEAEGFLWGRDKQGVYARASMPEAADDLARLRAENADHNALWARKYADLSAENEQQRRQINGLLDELQKVTTAGAAPSEGFVPDVTGPPAGVAIPTERKVIFKEAKVVRLDEVFVVKPET